MELINNNEQSRRKSPDWGRIKETVRNVIRMIIVLFILIGILYSFFSNLLKPHQEDKFKALDDTIKALFQLVQHPAISPIGISPIHAEWNSTN